MLIKLLYNKIEILFKFYYIIIFISNNYYIMTQTMDNIIYKEKTFRFYDIFDNQEHIYCDTTIIVLEKMSGGKYIYDITYKYNIPESNNNQCVCCGNIDRSHYNLSLRAHPFFYSKNISEDDKDGVIVYKNPMTEQLVKFLLMNINELDEYTGGTYWVQYKIKIMESLAKFSD